LTNQPNEPNTPASNTAQSDLDTFRMSLRYAWECRALDKYVAAGWTASDLDECIGLLSRLPNQGPMAPHQHLLVCAPESPLVRLVHLAIGRGLLNELDVRESAR
jgi:hypothetical protein